MTRVKEEEALYRTRVLANSNDHDAWHALGLLAFNVGNLSFAVQCLEAAIACNGKLALYHRNLGEIYRRLGKLQDAVQAGRRACQLAPNDINAYFNLGLAYTDAQDYAKAIQLYRKALKLNAKHGLSWNNLGSALEQQGDKVAALKAYKKAIALNSQHAEAHNNAGAIYSERGKLEQACHCFQSAIDAKEDFVEAHYNLSSLKTYKIDDPHLAMLEAVYASRASLSNHARIRYSFALGKALDDSGQYDRAYAAYQEGNQLQHALLPMDELAAEAMLERITTQFNEKFFAERRNWNIGQDSQRTPIFIVGMPRSGTTLLEQILCSHSAVYGAGELVDLNLAIVNTTHAMHGLSVIEQVAVLTEVDIKRIGEDYLKRVWKLSPTSLYITDKMPGNFFYLGMIHLALPGAKIIHAMRDPMDSCFSCYSRLFNDTMDFAYDQGTLGRYYVRYSKLMQHWHNVLPSGTILDLRYEQLVADTETQARRVLEFVGLPWDENCLKFHQHQRLVKTASVAQVRKPIYNSSVARWKHFARHLQPLYELVKDYRVSYDVEPLFSQTADIADATPEQLMQLASQHQSAGRLQEAEQLLRQLLQQQPHHAHALHLLGVVTHQAGKPELALQLINDAITIEASVALFHSNLAEMYRQQKRLADAINHGRRAVALDPSLASAHSNLGIALYDDKQYDAAEACHRQALVLMPGMLQSLSNLGSIERTRNNPAAAKTWYRKALAINPDYLEAMSNLGAVLVEDDSVDEAALVLARALSLQPNYPEALCNLGLVRLKQDNIEAAIALFQHSLQLKPGYPEALIGLARALSELDRLDEAKALLRQATENASDNAEAWCQLANVYTELGEAELAELAYNKALTLDKDMSDALAMLGNLRLEQGKIDQAEALLKQAIAVNSNNFSARFHLTLVKKVTPGDANLAALEALLPEIDRLKSEENRISLHYALGKAYDDLKDYDKAFPHFLEGAQLKRSKLNYNAAVDEARCRRIMEVVDQEFIDRLKGAGDASSVPVFVLGMPRSGTTLTEQIIASHPAVHGAGELRDLMDIVQQTMPDQSFQGYPENLSTLTQETLTAWAQDYLARLPHRAPQALRITDKMPVNYLALGLIPLLLPNAKIVHVKRNPIDTCVSCFTRLFNRHQDASYDLAELGYHYVNYDRLMRHWHEVLPTGSFLEVQYEDIVADMEGQARRLIDFCGLEWDDACLAFHKNQRTIRTASVVQVRQPIYTSSVERWRHYEKFLSPLLAALDFIAKD